MVAYSNGQGVDPLFSPEILLAHSRRHFMRGDGSLAYGSARLALFLIHNYPQLFSAELNTGTLSTALVQAMSCARHTDEWDLAADTLRRSWVVLKNGSTSRSLGRPDCLRLLAECVSILSDLDAVRAARDLTANLDEHSRWAKSRAARDDFATQVKGLRRAAIAELAAGKLGEATRRLLTMWTTERWDWPLDLRTATGNVVVWSLVQQGEDVLARDLAIENQAGIVDDSGRVREFSVTPWNAVEAVLTTGATVERTEHTKRLLERTLEFVDEVVSINITDRNFVLRPVAFDFSTDGARCVGDWAASKGLEARPVSETTRRELVPIVKGIVRSLLLNLRRAPIS